MIKSKKIINVYKDKFYKKIYGTKNASYKQKL